MSETVHAARQFGEFGHAWFRGALSAAGLSELDQIADANMGAGIRVPISGELIDTLSSNQYLAQAINTIADNARPVRCVVFNKSGTENWGVAWHQDRLIAVRERHEIDGFTNWSKKSGIWHCEPPLALLEQMFFARIHLDDATEENGAMVVARGSHELGPVPSVEAEAFATNYPQDSCTAKRGDISFTKMLTLHMSKPVTNTSTRRAIRIDYAGFDLPYPLVWN